MSIQEMQAAFGGALSEAQIVRLRAGQWMSRALAEMAASRERLTRWAQAGCPSSGFGPNVVAIGRHTHDLAGRVFERLPAPVAWHVAAHVVIIGIEPGRGLCGTVPRMSVEPAAEALQIIALSEGPCDREADALMKHECAHAWTAPVIAFEAERSTTRDQRTTVNLASEWPDLAEAMVARQMRDEELAHILSAEWGGVGAASDLRSLRRRGVREYLMEGLLE